ncbi:LamG-like jellyroll fold domain-containing protein [Propionicimonas sp.]|uniref:LamG-like jellyroll fold domain-containing protein n=1 Tax=Propionicimonas sp. TaxID=1955623 RepID=UPI0039E3C027
MTKRAAVWAAAVIGAAVVVAALIVASGLRFYTVMTPSMGETAPVGTLVVTRPADAFQVGEIVTYERNGRSYTHRIITANQDGTFVTKGDLNGSADPLPVSTGEIVGRAIWIAPGMGWLWRGLPWLLLGGLVVYAVSLMPRFDRTWRWVVRLSGWTLVICLVAFWLRPWVSLTMLSWVPADTGGADMHVVNTGLFPLDVLGNRLVSGQDVIVRVTEQNAAGEYTLTPALAFHWWEQLGLLLLCLVPTLIALVIRDDRTPHEPGRAVEEDAVADPDAAKDEPAEEESDDAPDLRRLILIAAIVFAVVVSVAVVTFSTTSAALTAKIANSTNTSGNRTFFTCTNAVTSSSGSPYLAWAMGTGSTTKAADLNGSSSSTKVGTFANTTALGASPTGTTTVGCNNDLPKASVSFNGTSQCLFTGATVSNPQTFSLEAWFWTGTKPNGKIIGFGNTQSGGDSTYDRHVYIDDAGRVLFGTYNNGFQVIASPSGTSYADSKWHNVIATFSSSTGMRLYIDGAVVASSTSYTVAENTSGYWKAGCGNLGGSWPNAAGAASWNSLNYFKGQLQFAAVYSAVLTATQVKEHYQAGLG